MPEEAGGGERSGAAGDTATGFEAEAGTTGEVYFMETGIGVRKGVWALYSFSMESPETATFWNDGAPPPLFIIDSMSDRIVRIFTSNGGGGGALANTLFRGFSI